MYFKSSMGLSIRPFIAYRIEAGLLRSGNSPENNRKAKYYRLTTLGRKQLAAQQSRWDQLVRAIGRIMNPTAQEAK